MVSLLGFLPLFVAVLVLLIVPLASRNRRLDTRLTQFSRQYFGRYVPAEAPERQRRLRAAYVDETYRSYAAKTYVITALASIAAVIVGVYVFGGILLVLPTIGEFINTLPNTMANALGRPELDPDLTANQVLMVVSAGGAVSGLVVGGLTYWWRWEKPRSDAEVRRRGINEGMPRTVAFVYALSRGGMEIPEVLRTLARNREVYGDGADEISVAVREMDLFGNDMITAVRRVSTRTPSERFKTFAENLASVLQSGQSLSEFLRDQYDRLQDEAAERQAEILELLSTIAEGYVTVLVAGTLFMMTILLIFGLTTTPTINFLRLLAYVMIPLANVLFIVYLSSKLEMLGVARGTDVSPLRGALSERFALPDRTADDAGDATVDVDVDVDVTADADATSAVHADGAGAGTLAGRRQLERYDSVSGLRSALGQPIQTFREDPTKVLYVTAPLAVLWVAIRAPSAVNANGLDLRTLDDILIRALLFVIGSFAVFWELYSRRISRMEEQLPELLDRLGNLNRAGLSIVESLDRVRDSDLGVLTDEVERIYRDVEYGANVDDALLRFGMRVRTTATTRVVTLLTNALRASGSLSPILDIAAEQAESELRLRRRRRQQMFSYLVVIYVSFMVFLVIILAVQEVLVPSLPNNVPVPSGEQTERLAVDASQFARFGQVNKAAYTLVFFHTALVQAVMSGFIGGQLGEGSIKDGAKHAAIMLGVAYVAFLALNSPTAQITFEQQSVEAGTVEVTSVSMTDGGFVVIRDGSPDGNIVGRSDYLPPGTHTELRVDLETNVGGERNLYAVPHLDTDDDGEFDFTGDPEGVDRPYPGGRTSIADSAQVSPDDSSSALDRPAAVEAPQATLAPVRDGPGTPLDRRVSGS